MGAKKGFWIRRLWGPWHEIAWCSENKEYVFTLCGLYWWLGDSECALRAEKSVPGFVCGNCKRIAVAREVRERDEVRDANGKRLQVKRLVSPKQIQEVQDVD